VRGHSAARTHRHSASLRYRTKRPASSARDAESDAGCFVPADWRYSHANVTGMSAAFMESEMGPDVALHDKATIKCFADHLAYIDQRM